MAPAPGSLRPSPLNAVVQNHSGCARLTVWYSYAIIRVVPRVERGEFLNVGVVLFAREQEFLGTRIEVDPRRLLNLAANLDLGAVDRHLATFQAITDGLPGGGPIAALPPPERFHWLVSPRRPSKSARRSARRVRAARWFRQRELAARSAPRARADHRRRMAWPGRCA